jgi:hypothetical protein
MVEEQQLPQNNENNDNTNNINDDDDHDDENHNNDNDDDDKDDEDYTPLSDSEKEKMYCDTDELKTFGNEALISIDQLQDLLGHIGITTALKFRLKRVLHRGREEFRAVVEIFNRPNVIPDFVNKTKYSSHVCTGSVIPHTWT